MKRFFSSGLAVIAANIWFGQVTNAQPRFEVASVKPGPADAIGSMNGGPLPVGPFNQTNHDPSRITWTNVRLGRVIQVAYDLPANRISGPDWLSSDVVSIVATVPMGTSVGDFRLMVQNLLTERFKLTVHRERKEVSGYSLEVAKNGLKITDALQASKDDSKAGEAAPVANALMVVDQSGFPAPRPGNPIYISGGGFEATIAVNGRYRATVLNDPMLKIATFFGNAIGMPVDDQTGLAGSYSFHLEYVPNVPNAAAAAADPDADIFDAVQSQLGLKLTSKKVPVETLVIDHVERAPTEN